MLGLLGLLGSGPGGQTAACGMETANSTSLCCSVGLFWRKGRELCAWRVTGSAVTQVAAGPAAFQTSGMGRQGGKGPSAALCQPSALPRAAVLGESQIGMGPSAPNGTWLGTA